MDSMEGKFLRLGVEHAPGQASNQAHVKLDLQGEPLSGSLVDFSHGDVDAFLPIPGAADAFMAGVHRGGAQAYTEYKGEAALRSSVAQKLARFTGAKINPHTNLIITPGTQGALFLALGSTIDRGDKVAIVQPDYFANRKIVEFLDGEVVPIDMDFHEVKNRAGLDFDQLEDAFKHGVKLFVFSNPNNPTGVIYSPDEIAQIAKLAANYGVKVIVDELYARQIFDHNRYTHLCAEASIDPEHVITIIGPSKTESLSGYRIGVAFGSATIIARMEKLQAIVSLRAGGYSQAILQAWFSEPEGWMAERIAQHQSIRDQLVRKFQNSNRFQVRATEGGSYLFPQVKHLTMPIEDFTKVLQHQANVVVTPGTEFGSPFTRSFRINFSQDPQAASEAVDRMITIAARYSQGVNTR